MNLLNSKDLSVNLSYIYQKYFYKGRVLFSCSELMETQSYSYNILQHFCYSFEFNLTDGNLAAVKCYFTALEREV